jgi:hypothetical protein
MRQLATSTADGLAGWTGLQQFVRPRPPVERCELCSAPLGPEHPHLVEPESRKIVCACDACALLFDRGDAKRYRRVPRDARRLADFRLSDLQWNALAIPVGLAFFLHSTAANRVIALYPSPAGATEAALDLDSWNDIAGENPVLESMTADTEALLVNRLSEPRQYYLAPIDKCYQLVGLVRTHWRGISGGSQVWEEIRRFFERLGS